MRKKLTELDDEEGDIADDPVLHRISLEIESVSRSCDRWMLFALAILFGEVLVVEKLQLRSAWTNASAVLTVFTILAGTIYANIRRKQRIAFDHGLHCSVCGGRPQVTMILSAAMTRRCKKCGATLNVV